MGSFLMRISDLATSLSLSRSDYELAEVLKKNSPPGYAEAILKRLNYSRLTIGQLKTLRDRVYPLVADHELGVKLMTFLKGLPNNVQSMLMTECPFLNGHQTCTLKEGMIAVPGIQEDTAVFVQGNLTNEETIELLAQKGSQFTVIKLSDVSTPLLESIKAHCTNLKSFSISLSDANILNTRVVDIKLILDFPPLESLNLNLWNLFTVTYDDITALVSSKKFSQSMKDLSIAVPFTDDKILEKLADYEQLESLNLTSLSMQPEGVVSFLNAQKKTLKSLTLLKGEEWPVLVNNDVLKALAECSQLNNLEINGKWEINSSCECSYEGLSKTLSSLKYLERLSIVGYPIDAATAECIGKMESLKKIYLADCSKVENFSALLAFIQNLSHIGLGKCYYLEEVSRVFERAKNLTKLDLSSCGGFYHNLPEFCKLENIQATLKELSINDLQSVINSDFGSIKKLRNLETLRIADCPTFNDTSMKELWGSHHRSRIKNLELCKVSISDSSLDLLFTLPNLQVLMLASNYAITKGGIESLLKSKTLHKQIEKLYLSGFALPKEFIPYFNDFKKLIVLLLGNPMEIHYDEAYQLVKNLSCVKEKNVSAEVFLGELTTWNNFEKRN